MIDSAIAEWTRDETVELVADRMVPFWQRVCVESEQIGPICIVTHGGPLAYILHRMGLPRDELNAYKQKWSDHPVPPGGLWSAASDTVEGPWDLDIVFTPWTPALSQ